MESRRSRREAAPTLEQLRESRRCQTNIIDFAEDTDDPADAGSEEEDEVVRVEDENSDEDDEMNQQIPPNRQAPVQASALVEVETIWNGIQFRQNKKCVEVFKIF